ncbi:peptidoglycan-binding protein [Streptomyces sp. NPDC050617]|uniref:HlyD family efflux transporter periplasmic adaptor subunit n=1 Tax=Streptomyces sp. NPDC050617 TaxID=3154628 RepID=UPI0034327374
MASTEYEAPTADGEAVYAEAYADAPGPRPRRRRAVLLAVGILVVTAIAGGAVLVLGDGGSKSTAATGKAAVETAAVKRADLSDTQELGGTLGYGTEKPVKGAKKGVVTWLPASGATVTRGKPLYKVDDRPVPVFYGATPLYRKLDKPGAEGPDVKVVADNLRALGYDFDGVPGGSGGADRNGTAGAGADHGRFTASLSAAIKRWQKHVGMAPTGSLDVGDVVVAPGEVRVGVVKAQLGDEAAGELLTLTPTAKAVTVSVDSADVGSIKKGAKVSVMLPDGKETPGEVSNISRVSSGGGADADSGSGGPAKSDVTVHLTDSAPGKFDAASVRVKFTSQTRHGVLTVPVGALLALSEGGYAVQRPGGGLIAVETGMFSRGMVEVTGKGLTEGTKVVVAS